MICGENKRLTADHVPPKCTGNNGSVELTTLAEYFAMEDIKPLRGRKGQTFKTLCLDCNSHLLGGLDNEIANVYQECMRYLNAFAKHDYPLSSVTIRCDVKKFCRGLVGHLIAAQPEDKCKVKPPDGGMVKQLRDFVVFGGDDILKTHSIFLWFYPHINTVTANYIGKREWFQVEESAVFSVLKFFPFGFAVVTKDGSKFFNPQNEITVKDKEIVFDFSLAKKMPPDFPLNLADNEYFVMADEYCYVSTPSV